MQLFQDQFLDVGAPIPRQPRVGDDVETILYGASCREDDVLHEGRLPNFRVGDFLVYYAVGAYNANLSPDFIFETPPLVVL